MSNTYPIVAVTGSSGAGTTTVRHAFADIFRREGIKAAFVEGDSFRRYDRKDMKQADTALRQIEEVISVTLLQEGTAAGTTPAGEGRAAR